MVAMPKEGWAFKTSTQSFRAEQFCPFNALLGIGKSFLLDAPPGRAGNDKQINGHKVEISVECTITDNHSSESEGGDDEGGGDDEEDDHVGQGVHSSPWSISLMVNLRAKYTSPRASNSQSSEFKIRAVFPAAGLPDSSKLAPDRKGLVTDKKRHQDRCGGWLEVEQQQPVYINEPQDNTLAYQPSILDLGLDGRTSTKSRADRMPEAPDAYSAYETGLGLLLEKLTCGRSRYLKALTYQQRLGENILKCRIYGETESLKVERSEIIHYLNELSLTALGRPFNELCDPPAVQSW